MLGAPVRRKRPQDRQRRTGRGEAGQVMLIVVGLIALLSTVPLVVLSTATGQLANTTENLDWNAAYEAAQAGLNDYIEHHDQNNAYVQWTSGNPNFKCTYGPTTAYGYEYVSNAWSWVNLKDSGLCGWAT